MSNVYKCLDSIYALKLQDVIKHPRFGMLRIIGIYETNYDDYEVCCKRLNGMSSNLMLKGLELNQLKLKANGKPNLTVLK